MKQTTETESLDVLFAQICRLKHTRIQSLLEALGLYEGQPALLRSLWEEEGLTHTELARRLHVRPATVTKMIQRMEKSGFVERRPDPADQRLSRVYLTQTGCSVQDGVRQIWHTLESEAFSGFSEDERLQLQRSFRQIRENLRLASAPGWHHVHQLIPEDR
jgi:MarR family transcriptional regulator, organic hydroperoxide resistance regulator